MVADLERKGEAKRKAGRIRRRYIASASFEESIKDETWVWESGWGSGELRLHAASIGSAGTADIWVQERISATICSAEAVGVSEEGSWRVWDGVVEEAYCSCFQFRHARVIWDCRGENAEEV